MHLALIGPARTGTATNGYAARLAPALRDLGHRVDELDAAPGVLDRLAEGARPVIDALVLPRFAGSMAALAARDAAALVHHPGAHVVYDAGQPGAERPLLAAMPRLIASSAPVEARLVGEYGIDPARIRVVVPGSPDRPRSTPAGGPCAVLSVGILAPRKRFEHLADALELLSDLDWTLTIAGDSGRDPGYEQALAARTGPRIRLMPDPSPEVLEALWQGAAIFALATRWEGYPTAIAEALRRGVPVATTNGGGAGLLVPEAAGAVYPVDDLPTLSKSLRRMVFDHALRASMAEAAWQAGRALPDWPTQARAFTAALED